MNHIKDVQMVTFFRMILGLGGALLLALPAIAQESVPADTDQIVQTQAETEPLRENTGPPVYVIPALTFQAAMSYALAHSPSLQAAQYRQQGASAQASARLDGTPNPVLSVEAEDFLGNGPARGVNSMQITTTVSQELELGKKFSGRKKVRSLKREAADVALDIQRRQVLGEVAMGFVEVLAQQVRVEHAAEMVRLSHKTVETVTAQVDAGRSTEMEIEKAEVELALSSLHELAAKRALESARVRLAAACGSREVFFGEVVGALDAASELPPLSDLLARMAQHPELRDAAVRVQVQQALADMEKANRIPNLTVDLGYRYNNAASNHALVAGVGIPIPLLDRNRGNIDAAAKEVLSAQSDVEMLDTELTKLIVSEYYNVQFQMERMTVLHETISPRVTATFAAVEEGYRIGRFGYLDLLDAQRTLFEVEHMVLDAQIQYQLSRILLNRIAGIPFSAIMFSADATRAKDSQ
ncbi:MAG: TolC family protein [Deltaproteobacteria bacterium]|nr:TolC family protein [Deltaproteobacteria bacterium]